MNFQDRVVVVTGGASGMGAASANLFAELGAAVYVLDVNNVDALNDNIEMMVCDVADYNAVKKAVDTIVSTEKKIDHLFTNAGKLLSAKLVDSSIADIDDVIDVNLKGNYYVLKAVLPIMMKNKFGTIVLMGSDQSLIGKMDNSIYGSTKAGVAQLAKSLTVEYAEYNIRVNCVCPGTIDTPYCRNAVEAYAQRMAVKEEDVLCELSNAQPIKRMGVPEEVANLVVFLTSSFRLTICSFNNSISSSIAPIIAIFITISAIVRNQY